jgi:hypothetical protein
MQGPNTIFYLAAWPLESHAALFIIDVQLMHISNSTRLAIYLYIMNIIQGLLVRLLVLSIL